MVIEVVIESAWQEDYRFQKLNKEKAMQQNTWLLNI